MIYSDCSSNIAGKDVVVFGDSTTFGFRDRRSRIKDQEGLSRIMNNSYGTFKGLISHVNLAYDMKTQQPIGISDVRFIERDYLSRASKDETRQRDLEPIELKESYKWIIGFLETKKRLKACSRLTLVADRESDIIELFDRIPDEKTDVVIRSQHNRNIIQQDGSTKKLKEIISSFPVKGSRTMPIRTKKRKKRSAKLEIRYGQVTLPWPKDKKKTTYRNNQSGIEAYIVDIKECTHKGYSTEKPLHWRLITTRTIQTLEQAEQIIKLYEQRWKIEEYFKLLKTDCFDIENTELTRGRTIRKLILYVMKVGIKIQHLKASRSGETNSKINTIFTEQEIDCIWKLSPKLEGGTEKQKNPYDRNSLAFASWVIARLGGWKEFYDPKRPPGSKTFVWGLEKFENIMFAKTLFEDVS